MAMFSKVNNGAIFSDSFGLFLQECLRAQHDVKLLTEQLTQQSDYCSSLGSACCSLLWWVSRQEECIQAILAGVRTSKLLRFSLWLKMSSTYPPSRETQLLAMNWLVLVITPKNTFKVTDQSHTSEILLKW